MEVRKSGRRGLAEQVRGCGRPAPGWRRPPTPDAAPRAPRRPGGAPASASPFQEATVTGGEWMDAPAPQARSRGHLENQRGDRARAEAAAPFETSVGMTVMPIRAGRFKMGSTAAERQRLLDSIEPAFWEGVQDWLRTGAPQHEVRLSRDFHVAVHTVTVGQFCRFVAGTGYRTDAEREGPGAWGYDAETKRHGLLALDQGRAGSQRLVPPPLGAVDPPHPVAVPPCQSAPVPRAGGSVVALARGSPALRRAPLAARGAHHGVVGARRRGAPRP
jgi:hypothetical protein